MRSNPNIRNIVISYRIRNFEGGFKMKDYSIYTCRRHIDIDESRASTSA